MKLAWLEDFLMLVEAGTFSKAAAVRNVSQPAFSRRIQMLEHWLGVDLVDRSGSRPTLTPTAMQFEPEVRRLAHQFRELRRQMRAHCAADRRITIVTQHALMVSYMPRLLYFLGSHLNATTFQVRTGGRDECVAQLIAGQASMLLCFESDDQPMPSSIDRVEHFFIGSEQLLPVVAADDAGRPLHRAQCDQGCKLLQYPDNSFLGRVVRTHCLPELAKRCRLETVCESAFTLGLRQMVLTGMGIAWLPYGLVKHDIETGVLAALPTTLVSPMLRISIYYRCDQGDIKLDGIGRLFREEWEVINSRIETDSAERLAPAQ